MRKERRRIFLLKCGLIRETGIIGMRSENFKKIIFGNGQNTLSLIILIALLRGILSLVSIYQKQYGNFKFISVFTYLGFRSKLK